MIIYLVLLLSLFLRLISLNQSLWLDEAINVLAAKNYSFYEMLTKYAIADFHPPGYFSILWVWTHIFGFSEISVRSPSVIFGVLTIFVTYLFVTKLVSKKVGLLCAFLLTINPLHIYYSQEARMYSFAAFSVCLSMYYLLKNLKGEKSLLLLILSNSLVLLSDYVAYLIFPAQLIILLFLKNKQFVKQWLKALVISLIPGFLWLPIFIEQLKVGIQTSINIPTWKLVVGSFDLKDLILTFVKFITGRIDINNNIQFELILLFPILITTLLIWRAFKTSIRTDRIIIFGWLVLPIVFAAVVSLIIPVYSYARLLFCLPIFIIAIGIGIYSLKSKLKFLILIFFVSMQIFFSSLYLTMPQFQRENWKGLVGFLKSKNLKVVMESNGSFSPFEYYSNNKVEVVAGLNKFPARNFEDVSNIEQQLSSEKEFFLLNYLVDISDPQRLVSKKITDLGYIQQDVINFNGVGLLYYYTK